jgi:hypothetical protein
MAPAEAGQSQVRCAAPADRACRHMKSQYRLCLFLLGFAADRNRRGGGVAACIMSDWDWEHSDLDRRGKLDPFVSGNGVVL